MKVFTQLVLWRKASQVNGLHGEDEEFMFNVVVRRQAWEDALVALNFESLPVEIRPFGIVHTEIWNADGTA